MSDRHSRVPYDRATLQGPSLRESDMAALTSPILPSPSSGPTGETFTKAMIRRNRGRHALGILLLLVTVVLWTASNFLASTIFADDTYSKPYFVTYVNTSFFVVPLVFMLGKQVVVDRSRGLSLSWRDLIRRRVGRYDLAKSEEHEPMEVDEEEENDIHDDDVMEVWNAGLGSRRGSTISERLDIDHDAAGLRRAGGHVHGEGLTLGDTAKLSLEFCMIWFLANYFTAACLSYTTVASSTILTSTSSVWTLIIGTVVGVEHFTMKKLLGVLASLVGIVLISTVDMSGQTDENRGSFPHKTPREIALGDALAFLSALLYGCYAVLMKKRIGDESRVNMPLFFGLVGLFNVVLLWPGLAVLHYTGVEPFELPPTAKVLTIVLVNSISSFVSDFCWAYAMLLTSPVVTTVGLSLTIPLSLIGQMVLDDQYSSFTYWIGAFVVLLSFLAVNHEESKDEDVPARWVLQRGREV